MKNSKETAEHRLKPFEFQPGQSGNPNGRPKGAKTGLRARFRQILDKEAPQDIIKVLESKGIKLNDRDHAEVIAQVTAREALKGNLYAVKLLIEQTEDPLGKDTGLTAQIIINISKEDADTC